MLIPVTLLSRSPWCCLSFLSTALSALKKFLIYDLAIPANNPLVDSLHTKEAFDECNFYWCSTPNNGRLEKAPTPCCPSHPSLHRHPPAVPKARGG